MGLGIDDMFVMMASWQKVQREHPSPNDRSTLPERMGMMLQMAGSSITITSFTDVVAFVIGSITVNWWKMSFQYFKIESFSLRIQMNWHV